MTFHGRTDEHEPAATGAQEFPAKSAGAPRAVIHVMNSAVRYLLRDRLLQQPRLVQQLTHPTKIAIVDGMTEVFSHIRHTTNRLRYDIARRHEPNLVLQYL